MTGRLLLAATLLLADAGDEKVTDKNWEHHPKIEAARAVFQEVEAGLKDKSLVLRTRKAVDECWEWSELQLATDAKGTPRYFHREGGGQDSTHTHSLYYDASGVLRFALLQGGAVTESTIAVRVWLDEKGREVYRRETAKGPGWTWIEGNAESQVKNPVEMFKKGAGGCKLGPPR
jgi:hypothetical protein